MAEIKSIRNNVIEVNAETVELAERMDESKEILNKAKEMLEEMRSSKIDTSQAP